MVDSNFGGMTRALCVLLATVAVAVGNPLCCVLTDCCHTAAAEQAEREAPACPHCKKQESAPEPVQQKAPCGCADKHPTLTTSPHGAKLHKPALELLALLPEQAPALHGVHAPVASRALATPQAAPAHVSLPLLL